MIKERIRLQSVILPLLITHEQRAILRWRYFIMALSSQVVRTHRQVQKRKKSDIGGT